MDTLYLDQSDISMLVLDRSSRLDGERRRLEALVRCGVVRLRVSIAHIAESAKLRFRRMATVPRYLSNLPGTMYVRAMPGEIYAAEAAGVTVDLRERPFRGFGLRETLRMAQLVGYIGPYADMVATSDNGIREGIRSLVGSRSRIRWPPRPLSAPGPATATYEALRHAVQWGLQRPTRRSDTLDGMHLAYACYSDIATIDGFVFDVTKKARSAYGSNTAWFPTGSLSTVLNYIEQRVQRTG